MNLSNLTPLQANTLKLLKANDNLIIKPTDKNLGPAIMYTISYIQQVLNEHLITTTYKQLTPAEAKYRMDS
jgi:mannose-1-phosphate guanylyltransferase